MKILFGLSCLMGLTVFSQMNSEASLLHVNEDMIFEIEPDIVKIDITMETPKSDPAQALEKNREVWGKVNEMAKSFSAIALADQEHVFRQSAGYSSYSGAPIDQFAAGRLATITLNKVSQYTTLAKKLSELDGVNLSAVSFFSSKKDSLEKEAEMVLAKKLKEHAQRQAAVTGGILGVMDSFSMSFTQYTGSKATAPLTSITQIYYNGYDLPVTPGKIGFRATANATYKADWSKK